MKNTFKLFGMLVVSILVLMVTAISIGPFLMNIDTDALMDVLSKSWGISSFISLFLYPILAFITIPSLIKRHLKAKGKHISPQKLKSFSWLFLLVLGVMDLLFIQLPYFLLI